MLDGVALADTTIARLNDDFLDQFRSFGVDAGLTAALGNILDVF